MGSHSVTCHQTQVNTLYLNPSQRSVLEYTYPGGMEGLGDWLDTKMVYLPTDGQPSKY